MHRRRLRGCTRRDEAATASQDLVERNFTPTARTGSTSRTSPNIARLGFQRSSQRLLEVLLMGGPIYSEEQRERFFEILDRGGTVGQRLGRLE